MRELSSAHGVLTGLDQPRSVPVRTWDVFAGSGVCAMRGRKVRHGCRRQVLCILPGRARGPKHAPPADECARQQRKRVQVRCARRCTGQWGGVATSTRLRWCGRSCRVLRYCHCAYTERYHERSWNLWRVKDLVPCGSRRGCVSRLCDSNVLCFWGGDGVHQLSGGEDNAGGSSGGVRLPVSCWVDFKRQHTELHTMHRGHICVVCKHGVHTVRAWEIRAGRSGSVHGLRRWEIFGHDCRTVSGGVSGLSGGLFRGLVWRKRVDAMHAVLSRVLLGVRWGNLGRQVHIVPVWILRHGSRERAASRMPTVCCGEILTAHGCNERDNMRRVLAKHIRIPAGIQRVHVVSSRYLFAVYRSQLHGVVSLLLLTGPVPALSDDARVHLLSRGLVHAKRFKLRRDRNTPLPAMSCGHSVSVPVTQCLQK